MQWGALETRSYETAKPPALQPLWRERIAITLAESSVVGSNEAMLGRRITRRSSHDVIGSS